MSKKISTKNKKKYIKTGDGKKMAINNSQLKISQKISKDFSTANEVYYENATEKSVEMIFEFYDDYTNLGVRQRKKLEKADTFDACKFNFEFEKDDPDFDIKVIYSELIELSNQEFFDLMKLVWDIDYKALLGILTNIMVDRISGKSIDAIEKEFKK